MILEYCSGDNKVLLEREQYYIDTFNPLLGPSVSRGRRAEYNILSQSGSSYGYRHTEETKEKFRNRKFTSETKLKLSQASEGRIIDEVTRIKISISHKEKVLSEETKSKISKFRTETSGVKVEVTNLLSGAINRYGSLTLASIDLGVSRTAVAKAANLGTKLKKIYVVKYITKD